MNQMNYFAHFIIPLHLSFSQHETVVNI